MKKLMVSLMLIIGMFAFAAESDPSATVGYVKYSCVTTAGTSNNLIALPVNSGYDTMTSLDPAATNINSVSEWDAAGQGWGNTANYIDYLFMWDADYPVSTGYAYSINATQPFDFIVDGPVEADPQYSLIATAGTSNNLIMHPLGFAADTSFVDLANSIGTCNSVAEWDASGQGWGNTANYIDYLFMWDADYPSEIGKPLMINVTSSSNWPGTKGQIEDAAPASLPKGTSRTVGYNVVDETGSAFAFPDPNVTFKCWITSRPGEELREYSTGSETAMLAVYSVVRCNIGNFPTQWAAGDEINFTIKDENFTPPYEATGSYILDGAGTALYLGLAPGTGSALQLDTPSSITDGMVPEVTKLHQNYPNPFNPTTSIKFDLAKDSNVKLNVYNYNGQMVKSLVSGEMNAGYHTVNFDASNLSAGVYYYTMEADNKVMTSKMVLVK